MIPIHDNRKSGALPVVTWTLIGLNILIYLWDRQWRLTGPSIVFADLTMTPQSIVGALKGDHSTSLVTILTSMFLHGNLLHLLGNMLFLFVFGPAVEIAMGGPRFSIYYLFWGVFAAATHIFVNTHSLVPVLGASGAIGGVLGAYLMLFPGNRIEIVIPIFAFFTFETPAWIMLGIWFAYQILVPQQGVANWAHVGGFLAGMVTVLVMGGRGAILRGRESEFEYDL